MLAPRLHSTFVPLALVAGLLVGCGDGSPTLVGTVQGDLSSAGATGGGFELYVNGRQTSVYVDAQGGFGTDGLPTGDIEIAIAGKNISGAIIVHDVQMDELLEIEVKISKNSLVIRLVRRQPMMYRDDPYEGGKYKYKYKCKSDNPFDGCMDDDSDSDSNGGFNPFG